MGKGFVVTGIRHNDILLGYFGKSGGSDERVLQVGKALVLLGREAKDEDV